MTYFCYESKYFCIMKTTEVTLRIILKWNVNDMVRKYSFCIKSFGRYKIVELHLKHTMLLIVVRLNLTVRTKLDIKCFSAHLQLINDKDRNSLVTYFIDIPSCALLLLLPLNFYTLPFIIVFNIVTLFSSAVSWSLRNWFLGSSLVV